MTMIQGFDAQLAPITTNGRYWMFLKNAQGEERVFPYDWLHDHLDTGTLWTVWDMGLPWDEDAIEDATAYLSGLYAQLEANRTGVAGYVEVTIGRAV